VIEDIKEPLSPDLTARAYKEAEDKAAAYVEFLARKILAENPELQEFVMAMGTYFFIDRAGETVDTEEQYMGPDYRYYIQDSDTVFAELNEFISEWDQHLKITGDAMRFTATGPVITNW